MPERDSTGSLVAQLPAWVDTNEGLIDVCVFPGATHGTTYIE